MAPFVRSHDLLRHYRSPVLVTGEGIGGETHGGIGLIRSIEFGGRHFANIFASLSTMTAGGFNDPTEIGNVGVPALRHLNVVFDYRTRRMWLYP